MARKKKAAAAVKFTETIIELSAGDIANIVLTIALSIMTASS